MCFHYQHFLHFKMSTHSNTTAYTRGMTLVELMVVLAIFAVISSIVIFNYGDFKSTISLQNLADDIGLSIRGVQGRAIGVQADSNLMFKGSYGIHFNLKQAGTDMEGSPKEFISFANANDDKNNATQERYDFNPNASTCDNAVGNECTELVKITSEDTITGICLESNCLDSGSLDIVFTRPNPEAHFCYIPDGGLSCDGNNYSNVTIQITNTPTGATKSVSVWNTGQINIQ